MCPVNRTRSAVAASSGRPLSEHWFTGHPCFMNRSWPGRISPSNPLGNRIFFSRVPAATASRSHPQGNLVISYCGTQRYGQRSFAYAGPDLWNTFPLTVRDPSLSLTQFCAQPKTVMFSRAHTHTHTHTHTHPFNGPVPGLPG